MSFEIGGIQPAPRITPAAATSAALATGTAATDAAMSVQPAVEVDLGGLFNGLPPELTSAFGTASAAWDRLEAAGARLHFSTGGPSGRLTVEVHDLEGAVRSTISGSDVLRIASGEEVR